MSDEFHFIGVSTHSSSIMQVFPRWAEILGLDAVMRGIDIPLAAPAGAHRAAIETVKHDDHVRGALITTHKVAVFEQAGDLFDELDRYASICREISCAFKRGPRLIGSAKDPITAGLSLNAIVGAGFWSDQESDVLCLGAGGAGAAIGVALLERPDPPRRILFTDVDVRRLEIVKAIHAQLPARCPIEYHAVAGTAESARLVASLPPRSLVINATGLGKDAPGSPLSDEAMFPAGGIVWELNYRGDLEFLRQAYRQPASLELGVHAGWQYFIDSWLAVIADVFALSITGDLANRLAAEAEAIRPPTALSPPLMPAL